MIISRTPVRISFFGGGTDYPAWYREHDGCVISTTINKYSYITARYLPPFFKYKHRIRYYQHEETETLEEIRHPSVRECAKFLNIQKGLEIVHNADLPSQSGLGSSSTFTVGMLQALHALKNYMPTKREMALQAIHVEQELIGEHVGSQDQIAAAFGGLNRITFNEKRTFEVDPIILSDERLIELQENLLLCFTGFARNASEIAKKQIKVTHQKEKELIAMIDLCNEAFKQLINVDEPIDSFGKLLGEQWKIKRGLTDHISNTEIDDIYNAGMASGALGGKLLGAGGGGFMLFYAPQHKHTNIKEKLKNKLFVPFRFDFTGSKVVYFSHQ